MAVFEYEGIRNGRKVRGSVEAGTRAEAISKVRSEGIVPLEVRERGNRFRLRLPRTRSVSEEELSLVLFQIHVLLESGVPLPDAVELVSRQVGNGTLSSALAGIKADLERGEPVSSAFRRAGVFPDFLPDMISAAETGENLEAVFRMSADHLRTVADMKSRVMGAVMYPAVVILMSLIALFIAVKFVVPRIAGVLEGLGRDVPLVTRLIVWGADLITYVLYALPFLTLTALILRKRFLPEEKLHRTVLKLPFLGRVILFLDISRFAHTLHMTLSSAVPFVTAFALAGASMSNRFLKSRVLDLREDVERGKPLHLVLRKAGFFPPLFVSLVETGERSGELERMLKVLGEIYRREVLRIVNLWVRTIEPVSILIIGAVVGLLVLSVILPLTEITAGVGR
ncbi:MAG: type II secretion system F family protein [Aquificota bacterium]|nr:type II secretion system F family protein [Aquificota bacterium]